METTKKKQPYFIDSHFHLPLLFERSDLDENNLLSHLKTSGVISGLNIVNSPEEFEILEDRNLFPGPSPSLLHAAGIHPHESEKLKNSYNWIRDISSHIVAVGEVGMDFHYEFSPRKTQLEVLLKMLELSMELDLPLIIHAREAEKELIDILKNEGFSGRKVVFHSFTGSRDKAFKIINNDWLISFTGIMTFKKCRYLRDVFKSLPLKKVMFETDAPFLAPVPFRGKVNLPGNVSAIYSCASKISGTSEELLSETVKKTFSEFFSVKFPGENY